MILTPEAENLIQDYLDTERARLWSRAHVHTYRKMTIAHSECPMCKAPVGHQCIGAKGKHVTSFHTDRLSVMRAYRFHNRSEYVLERRRLMREFISTQDGIGRPEHDDQRY